jgi:hypothetical protein
MATAKPSVDQTVRNSVDHALKGKARMVLADENSISVLSAGEQVIVALSFVRGLRVCVEMLGGMEVDECAIAGVSVPFTRRGRPQDNAVRRTLDEVLKRADPNELDGFCAALSDIVASADEHGDYYRMFITLVDTQEVAYG